MKMKPKLLLLAFTFSLMVSSCSIVKHHYTGGFHFEKHYAKKNSAQYPNPADTPSEGITESSGSYHQFNAEESQTKLIASNSPDNVEGAKIEERPPMYDRIGNTAAEKMPADTSYWHNKSSDDKIKNEIKAAKFSFLSGLIMGILATIAAISSIGMLASGLSLGILTYLALILFFLTFLSVVFFLYKLDQMKQTLGKQAGKDQSWDELEKLEKMAKKYKIVYIVIALVALAYLRLFGQIF
jgi:hypothetical protein